MQKLLLTDIDETCLKWIDPFFEWVVNEVGIAHKRDPKVWDFKDALGCHTSDESDAIIRWFNNTPHFGRLEPYPHAVEVINKLHDEGWKFIGISTCSSSETTKSLREENIRRVFGDVFLEVHCIEHQIGKESILQEFPGTWWVEDNTNWAEISLKYDHKPILITQPYNEDFNHPEIPKVADWREVYDIINQSN